MTEITLQVPEIHCDHCKMSIEDAVGAVAGVDRAEVTIPQRSVTVTFDGSAATRAAIVDAIEDQGYTVGG